MEDLSNAVETEGEEKDLLETETFHACFSPAGKGKKDELQHPAVPEGEKKKRKGGEFSAHVALPRARRLQCAKKLEPVTTPEYPEKKKKKRCADLGVARPDNARD